MNLLNLKGIKLLLACLLFLAIAKSSLSFDFKVYIATWNIAAKFSKSLPLEDLLGLEKTSGNRPDMYAIGFQELSFKPLVNKVRNEQWTSRLTDVLKKFDYVQVQSIQLQGLALILFAKRVHLLHLHSIQTQYTGTGLGGFWGDKGVVSIRLDIYNNTVCFLNSHLAAHDNGLEKRVQEYNHIIENHKYSVKGSKEILNHDYVFWFGDLNFRIQEDFLPEPESVERHVREGFLDDLILNDQLIQVRTEQRAFHHFTETIPSFPPTFKFKEGTHEYNLKRRPAWCDRVLYAVSDDNLSVLDVQQLHYNSHPNYTLSDHKPVTSEFQIQIQEEDTDLVVAFEIIDVWIAGAQKTVNFVLPNGFKQLAGDWVGIFDADFASLTDNKAWEYIDGPTSVKFPETVILNASKQYRLLYMKSTGTRGVFEVAGISAPFSVKKAVKENKISI